MPILMSKEEWNRICKWTDPNKEDPMVAKRREQLKQMDERSKKMTRDWPNSVENVNKRNEELRRDRIKAAEEANHKFYEQYVKRKAADAERRMFAARDTMFKEKDAPKLLLSAVIETAVLKEREEQVKFNKEIHRRKKEHDHKAELGIITKAKEYEKLQAERKQRRFEANKVNQIEILEQAKEVAERNRREHESELQMQILDNQRARDEIEALKDFDDKYKAAERARIRADMDQARREFEDRRKEREARDKLDDKLIEILNQSKCRIESRRRHFEKEEQEKRQKRLEEMSALLHSDDQQRNAWIFKAAEKMEQEKEASAKARIEAEEKKRAHIRADRIAEHQKFLVREEQKAHEMEVRKQWEMMNRFKNMEIYEDCKENQRLAIEKKTREYREVILKMIQERKDREAAQREAIRRHYGIVAEQKLRDADNQLLTHALALIEEAKELGRPTFPIEKALDRYCCMHRLYALPELYESLQKTLVDYQPPRDLSRPDADYSAPAPPPPPSDDLGPPTDAAAPASLTPPKAKPCPAGGPLFITPEDEIDFELPDYHKHGVYPTLLHPDTDCFTEACETGACKCDHHKLKQLYPDRETCEEVCNEQH